MASRAQWRFGIFAVGLQMVIKLNQVKLNSTMHSFLPSSLPAFLPSFLHSSHNPTILQSYSCIPSFLPSFLPSSLPPLRCDLGDGDRFQPSFATFCSHLPTAPYRRPVPCTGSPSRYRATTTFTSKAQRQDVARGHGTATRLHVQVGDACLLTSSSFTMFNLSATVLICLAGDASLPGT